MRYTLFNSILHLREREDKTGGKKLKKIAVINDLSGLGKCSLTAAIPVISVMGVQAVPFPTAVLSNQTGYDSYFWDDYTDRMDAIIEEWKARKFVPDGIYTGFLAGEEQADKILHFLDAFCNENTRILTDPVLGDHGKAHGFYTENLCGCMRRLAERAHVITPNLTEAMLLLHGKEETEKKWQILLKEGERAFLTEAENAAAALEKMYGCAAVVITGVDWKNNKKEHQIGNLVRESGINTWVSSPKEGGSYSGTGDLFASVLSAGLVQGFSMKSCAQKAVAFLGKAIHHTVQEGTDRNEGVCFEPYLKEL